MRVTNAILVVTTDCLFPGLLMWSCRAGMVLKPINQLVIFIKEADVALTNDFWKVAVNF